MSVLFYSLFNFIIYSFIGWIIEGIYNFTVTGRFKKEGFLIGPFKPMYGIAVTILILYKQIVEVDEVSLVLLCFLIPTTVEYISGYMLKHIFHKVYWDYSQFKYNINGLVTLKFSLYWMLLSLTGIYFLQGAIYNLYTKREEFFHILVVMAFTVFLLDLYTTLKNYNKVKVLNK
jgi:uncharacterized membrane protein